MACRSRIELGIPDGSGAELGSLGFNDLGNKIMVIIRASKGAAVTNIDWDDAEELWRWLGYKLGKQVPEVY